MVVRKSRGGCSVGVALEGLEGRTLLAADLSNLIVTRPATYVVGATPKGAASTNANLAAAVIAPGFQIQVRFTDNSLTPSQQAVFDDAAARWEQILTGDVPDTDVGVNGATDIVDDIRIDASAPAIDGVGGILGQAGPEAERNGTFLPITGEMQFDSADVANLQANGQLDDVILHEMGHVLGFGTIWAPKGLTTGTSGSDPRYTGANAVAQYQAIFGVSTTTVPLENTGGAGTKNSHWREADFNNELMTGFLNSGVENPLSRITIGQFVDLGYPGVNINAYDSYVPPGGGNPAPTIASLAALPTPTPTNSTFVLTANGVADNGSVQNVKFYRDTNGVPGLQILATSGDVPGDTLIGTDTTAPYTQTVSTTGVAPGTYTCYAQATDNQNNVSLTASTTETVINAVAATVVDRHLFYNNSFFDGNNPAANSSDDGAIATGKSALLPGGTATFSNVSSYSKGINGLMFDIAGLPSTTLVPTDFDVQVAPDGSTWTPGPTPTSVTVRIGGGTNLSNRVTVLFADNSLVNTWLRLTVKADGNTGLAAQDVSYFGNEVAETGNEPAEATTLPVDVLDYYGVRDHLRPYDNLAPVTWNWDFNRDGVTDAQDLMMTRANAGESLPLIHAPASLMSLESTQDSGDSQSPQQTRTTVITSHSLSFASAFGKRVTMRSLVIRGYGK